MSKDVLRYIVHRRSSDAIVLDGAQNEIFCVVPESICWNGLDQAAARAQDIADLFNRARATPTSGEQP